MQDETTPPAAPTEGQNCGCTCEFCAAGKHDQCQSGMCNMGKPKPEDTEGQS